MKVLLDNQIYESQRFGGISRYFNELQRGNKMVHRMVLYKQSNTVKREFFGKLKGKIFGSTICGGQRNLDKIDFYRQQLRSQEYDIFHPTYYDTYFLQGLKTPFVLTVHDMIHEKYAEYFGFSPDSLNKRELCSKADKIIAVSETTKTDIIDIFGIAERKIEVIYHASSFESLNVLKPDFDFSDREYLLFTGNRNGYKNFLTFLVAVGPLLEEQNMKLVCTGSEFSKLERKWIADLGVEKYVEHYYCKSDEELAYFYRNATGFVFPSLYEGFGFPLLEAFACGCPVTCSSGGALKEIAGDAAFYFEPKNVKSIRSALNEIISNEGLRRQLIEKGEDRLMNFSWNKCRQETQNVYCDVAAKSG